MLPIYVVAGQGFTNKYDADNYQLFTEMDMKELDIDNPDLIELCKKMEIERNKGNCVFKFLFFSDGKITSTIQWSSFLALKDGISVESNASNTYVSVCVLALSMEEARKKADELYKEYKAKEKEEEYQEYKRLKFKYS